MGNFIQPHGTTMKGHLGYGCDVMHKPFADLIIVVSFSQLTDVTCDYFGGILYTC
jgi:hypothetical protein